MVSIGRDWLPRWFGAKAHPASYDTVGPCLVALLVYFGCAVSFTLAPPSWLPPYARRDLRSRARTTRSLAGTLGALGGRWLRPRIKARARVGDRVTSSIPPLSSLHCSGAPSLLPSRRRFFAGVNVLGCRVLRLVYLALPLFSPSVSYHEILFWGSFLG